MAEAPYAVKRANPRFSFFADAEVTLRDGTGVRGQLAELSSRGCYIDALEPIPIRTKLRLRICDGMSTCELNGKVLYMHSGGGFGIFLIVARYCLVVSQPYWSRFDISLPRVLQPREDVPYGLAIGSAAFIPYFILGNVGGP